MYDPGAEKLTNSINGLVYKVNSTIFPAKTGIMFRLKKIWILCFLMIALSCFIRCINNETAVKDPRGDQYAGAASCMSCHKNIMNTYIHNNHFKTSSKNTYHELKGLIDSSNNTVAFINNQKVILNDKDTVFYQSYLVNNQMLSSEKMDVAFGSGEKAQTFAYWKDSQLYQLPLTYFSSLHTWTNSPNFPISKPYFTRVIPSRCLECHSSFVQTTEERVGLQMQLAEKFNQNSIIYGIDCERCHGPAAQHVQFHQENPTVKQAKYITTFNTLNRQQQLDLCGTCHGGNPAEIRSIFSFKPGDSLSSYYLFYNRNISEPDVHGMQLQLLAQSKCFQKSSMTCTTCHEAHQSEPSMQSFVSKCMACHQQSTHAVQMNTANSNCIACHMPLRSSKSLNFNNEAEGNSIPYMLRTHRIAVYNAAEQQ